jgi:hypothetical protein
MIQIEYHPMSTLFDPEELSLINYEQSVLFVDFWFERD